MIPEFKFRRKTTFQKKLEIKEALKDRRIKIVGATAVSVVVLGLAVIAIPEKTVEKKQSVTELFKTAGVTTEIDKVENLFQKQIEEANATISNNKTAMTGSTLASAGFDTSVITGDSIEEEIAAEEAAVAAVLAMSGQAVVEDEVSIEPEHPQIEGFSNPGFAKAQQYVNIRKKADESSTIVGKLPKNAFCEVLGETDGWYEIITNGVQGFIKSEYLVTGEEAWELADQLKIGYLRVITETLYVREEPTTESDIIALVSIDQKLDIAEMGEEWIKVRVPDSEQRGYINKSYIAVEFTLPKGQAVSTKSSSSSKSSKSGRAAKDCSNIVDYALQFVGNPYVYGGTSLTRGADCSGFTMSVYAKFGVYLPHSSSAQARCGTKVSASQLAPGDLIFYGKGGSINHVALYIGGGKVVHASSERTGIKISNAFYRTPVTIRRVR